jgi:hypothetical protein
MYIGATLLPHKHNIYIKGEKLVLRMYMGATLLSVVLIFLLSELIVFAQQSYHFPVYPTREYMRPLRGDYKYR